MAKKIYAVADKVPEGCDYLTAGKRYEVTSEPSKGRFMFLSDDDIPQYGRWVGSAHLNGGNWQRIEEDDDVVTLADQFAPFLDAAEPVTLHPGDYVLTADIKDEAEFVGGGAV